MKPSGRPPRQRVTISDIAAAAGVSKGAVSYALNGRPGVSAATRERVLEVARQLNWTPSASARAVSGKPAGAMGLALARPAQLLGSEPFFMELIAGLEDVLAAHSTALLLQVVTSREREVEILRSWWSARQVDGVILVDLIEDDPRVRLLHSQGVPAVNIGSPSASAGLSCVWTDDEGAMDQAVRYLVRLGHRRIARVAGPPELAHIAHRGRAMAATLAEFGLPMARDLTLDTDLTGEQGARATRRLLTARRPPTAIIFDNDVLAVAALGVVAELGLSVPRDVSLLAWDDSQLCRITRPTLSAMSRDVQALGRQAAAQLLDLVGGGPLQVNPGPVAAIVARASTGPSPTAGAFSR